MNVELQGVSAAPPARWHARIYARDGFGPVLHVASFELDPGDGDFGAAATERMGADDAFAALIAYPVDERITPGVGLFKASAWRPRLRAIEFSPSQLQVTRPGQIGTQRFFTHAGRPFCLYAVVKPVRKRPEALIGSLSAVLGTVRISG
ncbi:MAG: hypothetical protein ACYDHH_08600 [Solirubrobacteraceae bacterium]